QHPDDLRPARIAALGAVGRDIPFVGTQRTARGLLGARLRPTSPAQPPKLVERTVVVGKARRAGLAGDPVDVLAAPWIEDLLAGKTRRAGRMAIRETAHDDFGGSARQALGVRVEEPERPPRRPQRERPRWPEQLN